MPISDRHVVFGTGAIGMALIEHLYADGKQVRAVNRSGSAGVPEGVDVVGGDATDESFTTKACAGASVVYFCVNPPYTKWPELFLPLQAGVLAGQHRRGPSWSPSKTSTPTAPRLASP